MTEYIKIPNIFKRETFGKNKLLYGEYSSEELKYLSRCEWTWTEKVDGTNVRVLWDGYRVSFMGRTDRAQLPKDLEAKLTELFGGTDKEELFEQTFGQKPVILFGEGYGGKIQGVGPQYGAVDFILFDVMVGKQIGVDLYFDRDMYLMRESVEGIADVFGLKVVPIVGRGTLEQGIEYVKTHPMSTLGDLPMEGIVARPAVEMRNRGGDRVICKIKWRDFKPEVTEG